MLVYTIKKAIPIVTDLQERWRNRAVANGNSNAGTVIAHLEDEIHIPWNKIDFTRWMASKVLGFYKVGDMYTWSHIPEQETSMPIYGTLVNINEIHYMVKFSKKYQQPKVLQLRSFANNIHNVCPAQLRPLTEKEKALVDLSNRKALGTA